LRGERVELDTAIVLPVPKLSIGERVARRRRSDLEKIFGQVFDAIDGR
jgi:hypothetical protein